MLSVEHIQHVQHAISVQLFGQRLIFPVKLVKRAAAYSQIWQVMVVCDCRRGGGGGGGRGSSGGGGCALTAATDTSHCIGPINTVHSKCIFIQVHIFLR